MDAERAVKAEHPHAVLLIKACHKVEKFGFILRAGKRTGQRAHMLAYAFIIIFFELRDGMIVREDGEAIDFQIAFNAAEIVLEQALEYAEIRFGKAVYTAFGRAAALCGEAEGIFVCDEHERKVIVPKVRVEAVLGCKVKQALHLCIDAGNKRFPLPVSHAVVAENPGKAQQDAVLAEITV